jgi:hypothetical protein
MVSIRRHPAPLVGALTVTSRIYLVGLAHPCQQIVWFLSGDILRVSRAGSHRYHGSTWRFLNTLAKGSCGFGPAPSGSSRGCVLHILSQVTCLGVRSNRWTR